MPRLFFTELENPRWLRPLESAGHFRRAPAAEEYADGSFRLPPWFEGEYLVRMASIVPADVSEILAAFEDDGHPHAQRQILDAALSMPPEEAAKLVPKIVSFLDQEGRHHLDPEGLLRLLRLLAAGGEPEKKAMRHVANALFQPRAPSPDDTYPGLLPEPDTGLDDFWYGQLLPGASEVLRVAFGHTALTILSGWLKDLSRATGHGDAGDQGSFIWRPSVGAHSQNNDHGRGNPLVSVTRDVAMAIIKDDPSSLPDVIYRLEQMQTPIGHRVALHVLALSIADHVPEAVDIGTDHLMNPTYLARTYRHEYAELARALLSSVPNDITDPWLTLIVSDPLVDEFEARAICAFNLDKEVSEVTEADVEQWRKLRVRELLASAESALPPKLVDELAALNAVLGERGDTPADFPSWSQSFSGPTTPTGRSELEAMTGTQLLQYLESWTPNSDVWYGPSREGLGRELIEVVRINPSQLGDVADLLVAYNPTYVRSVLRGLEMALKEGRLIPWKPVLGLLDKISQRPDEGDMPFTGNEDPGWRWTHQEAARLLRTGLLADARLRPAAEFRALIWDILARLAESPHPSPEHEAQYGGSNMDPYTLALNIVRGQAIAAVIAYLSWLVSTEQIVVGSSPHETAPEVWEKLDAHLDPAHDPSPAVRTMYGQDFPFLARVSPQWASRNAELIFGVDQGDPDGQPRRDAAWLSYVSTHNPYAATFEILESIYMARVTDDNLTVALPPSSNRTPAGRTAEHVLLLCARGTIGINSADGLVRAYFEHALPASRAEALGHLGWLMFNEKGPVDDDFVGRLQELWNWRVAEASSSGKVEELSRFGWWFRSKRFDREWSVRNMALVAQTGHVTQMAGSIANDLEAYASDFPSESLDALEGLLADRESWETFSVVKHAPAILAAALDTDIPDLVAKANAIIEQLGRAGHLDVRERVAQARDGRPTT